MEAAFSTLRDFRAVYEAQYGFVWAAVRRLGVPAPLLEDAVQDTFVVAYRRRSAFVPGPARPWLYGIARGVASNYRRSARRAARKREALAGACVPSAPHSDDAHASLRAVDSFLDTLSSDDRELFVLSEVEGLTGPELSSTLQLTTRTIYRRRDRLRRRFAELAIDAGALKRRRPRASAASWSVLVPSLKPAAVGGLALVFALPKIAAAVGLVGAISVGWSVAHAGASAASGASAAVSRSPSPPAARPDASPVPPLPDLRQRPGVIAPTPRRAMTLVPPIGSRRGPASQRTPPARADRGAAQGALSRENALLHEAKSAVARQEFEVALRATARHAEEFPKSSMADLRSVLRVDALCGAGNVRQARGEARAFMASHPNAPLARNVGSACVAKTRDSGQRGK